MNVLKVWIPAGEGKLPPGLVRESWPGTRSRIIQWIATFDDTDPAALVGALVWAERLRHRLHEAGHRFVQVASYHPIPDDFSPSSYRVGSVE